MDMSYIDKKTLEDVRSMMKDHILPRLTQLEQEVLFLRRVTWPVCQAIRETSQLDDIHNKRMFAQCMGDMDEMFHLLRDKNSISRQQQQISLSTANLMREEIDMVLKSHPLT
jgi:hypothetical protein